MTKLPKNKKCSNCITFEVCKKYDITEESKMCIMKPCQYYDHEDKIFNDFRLPKGKTCSMCWAYTRCNAMIRFERTSTICHYYPIMFSEQEPKE